jgi:hypothetical protein
MAFREVTVVQVKKALRRWLRGEGERTIAKGVGIDRKTARRYIQAAVELGIERSSDGESQLSEELIGQVVEAVRPHRPDGHGEAWRALLVEEQCIKAWLKQGLTVVKIGILLERSGVSVPHRTQTVRVSDPPSATELQVDFGRLGLVSQLRPGNAQADRGRPAHNRRLRTDHPRCHRDRRHLRALRREAPLDCDNPHIES